MKSLEQVIYIKGVGSEPSERNDILKLWRRYGLDIKHQTIDWTSTDYIERLSEIGAYIVRMSEQRRVSLVGDSGGGKPVLALFAKYHPHHIHRAVIISAKINPYNIKPATRDALPNLAISSDTLPESLKNIQNEMAGNILCVHPLNDEVVHPTDAVLKGAHEFTVPAEGHIAGIAYALKIGAEQIANFIRQE